jgi:hypothetical protein
MTTLCWLVPGVTAAVLLAWGVASHAPGFMLPVVLTAAAGYLAMTRWREQAASIAGYLETYHEDENDNPSYFHRLGRLQATLADDGGRDWHVITFFNVISVMAAAVAWLSSHSADHGELWAGVVTACALVFASYSVSDTARAQQTDPGAQWRRADSGLREVKRRTGLS